jgi:hypothetical protein
LKKTKELKYLDVFKKDVERSVTILENFDDNQRMKDSFIKNIIELFDTTEDYLRFMDNFGVFYEDFSEFIDLLFFNSTKLNSEDERELFWELSNFILYDTNSIQKGEKMKEVCDIYRIKTFFKNRDLSGLFSSLNLSLEELYKKLKSFSFGEQVPQLVRFEYIQGFHCADNHELNPYKYELFEFEERPDLNVNISPSGIGELIVLDKNFFNLEKTDDVSIADIKVLYSKFLRLYIHNHLKYLCDNKGLEEAKSSLVNDKTLKKCLINTLNRNLAEISLYNPSQLIEACMLGRIPVYDELLDYLDESGESEYVEEIRCHLDYEY